MMMMMMMMMMEGRGVSPLTTMPLFHMTVHSAGCVTGDVHSHTHSTYIHTVQKPTVEYVMRSLPSPAGVAAGVRNGDASTVFGV